MATEHFECTIERNDAGAIARIGVTVDDGENGPKCVVVNGNRAQLIAGALHAILRRGGITARRWSSARPIELSQTTGAQAWLLLTASKPLRRADRVDEVAEGVAAMSAEEASYWFAKAQQPRGLRAARLMLSDDGRRR